MSMLRRPQFSSHQSECVPGLMELSEPNAAKLICFIKLFPSCHSVNGVSLACILDYGRWWGKESPIHTVLPIEGGNQ
ncbi:hypothetical protein FXO37_21748 [Capsicum annuum]|nr:hypothetical protein FXO37_21748 [Capsicum annuum]